MSQRAVLALDLCLGACTVAVRNGGAEAARAEPMTRGHQERLAPLVQAVLQEAGLKPADLGRIGVTVGPGSFTGLRVGLAFAKVLASSLDIDCVGFSSLKALAASAPAAPGATAAVIASRGEDLFAQIFIDGVEVGAPELLDASLLMARLVDVAPGGPWRLVGPAAQPVGQEIPGAKVLDLAYPTPQALMRLTLDAAKPRSRPRPLYLRAPDARTLEERHTAAIHG